MRNTYCALRSPLSVFLFFAVSILLSVPAFAGDTAVANSEINAGHAEVKRDVNEIQAGLAPHFYTRKDQLYSPLWHQGLSAEGIELRYNRSGNNSVHQVLVAVSKSKIKAGPTWEYVSWPTNEAVTTWPVYITHINLGYAYLHTLPTPDVVTLRLGGALDVELQNIEWMIADYGFGSYLGTIDLDVKAELNVPLGKRHDLTLDLALPIVAWVARSPYSIHDETTIFNNRDDNIPKTVVRYLGAGRLETWNSYQAVKAALTWRRQITASAGLALSIHTKMVAIRKPRPVVATDTGINIAANFRF